jgi:hypothetical protein
MAVNLVLHLESSNQSTSSESTQTYIFLLAPLAELRSRTLIPNLSFHHGYHCISLLFINHLGQYMLDGIVSVDELWEQIILDPVAESVQVSGI